MSKRAKYCLWISLGIMIFFFAMQTLLVLEILVPTLLYARIGYVCFILFTPFFFFFMREYRKEASNFRKDFDEFFTDTAIISKTDNKGKIIYVNKKFEEISGWKLKDVLGKDHNVVNSGIHSRDFWSNMYKTTIKDRKVWNSVVTNISKTGKIYHVDTYIKADFDKNDKLTGFTSIRQDVTEIVNLNEKLNNLVSSQTSYVLRTDMQGKHTYWNEKFEKEFGWVYEGKMMHGDSLLSICESHHGAAYAAVKECLSEPGKIIKVELDKPSKDGGRKTTLWEFICILDQKGNPFEVQCMGIDISDRKEAENNLKKAIKDIERKNIYLEHAAKIIRHDMHSGINTYIPRGITSLERRLNPEIIKDLKIESPLKMLKEGLKHTQKVYKGVYEWTNLVKQEGKLEKKPYNLREILINYLDSTAYVNQVAISDWMPVVEVNEPLFCTAIDNLIRNGLKYNDSENKLVAIYMESEDCIAIQDNGRGMTQEEFEILSQPYQRKEGQKESGTGLGLNICIAILHEHGFSVSCSKLVDGGTQIKVKVKL